jgi:hypothetical protein
MALILCIECKGKVSTLAKACPHCGAPVIATGAEAPKSQVTVQTIAPVAPNPPAEERAWNRQELAALTVVVPKPPIEAPQQVTFPDLPEPKPSNELKAAGDLPEKGLRSRRWSYILSPIGSAIAATIVAVILLAAREGHEEELNVKNIGRNAGIVNHYPKVGIPMMIFRFVSDEVVVAVLVIWWTVALLMAVIRLGEKNAT